MHTTTVSPVPRSIEAPRGARWAASAFLSLMSVLRRSQVAMRAAAERRRRVAEAAEARAVANEYAARGEHRIAAEIHAAADRHDWGL